MIGDAFAFIDPVFSSGVLLAMTSAIGARSPSMARQSEGRSRDGAQGRTAHATIDGQNRLAYLSHQPSDFTRMFMAPSESFQMRAGLVSILAGNLQRNWRYSAPFLAFKSVFYALSLAIYSVFGLCRQTTLE